MEQPAIELIELKFLLRLLEHPPNYHSLISKISPNKKTSAADRNRACESLCSKGLVKYEEEIQRYHTTTAGKTLLKLDTGVSPANLDELQLLKVAAEKIATPSQAKKVSPEDRQHLLQQLESRGLITSSKKQIKEVWLTSLGKRFLRDEYVSASTATMTIAMLSSYLTFMRQFIDKAVEADTEGKTVPPPASAANTITSHAVLDVIRQLDQQLGTDNYLPIFHLREKLEPPLDREELDSLLYELQRSDRIELSTLQDVSAYSDAELAAGIPQDIGGALFFISVS